MSRWDKAKAGKSGRAGRQAGGGDLAHHFCEFSSSFCESDKRQNPSVPRSMPLTKGLKEFDGIRTKRIFAEIKFSKSVERTFNSKSPFLFVGLLDAGMEKLVIGGKVTLSFGNKGQGLCAAKNWRLVIWSFHPGTIKCSPTWCHLVESKPSSQSLGNPTATSRSVTFTGESFSAIKRNILFDSSDCTGITTHPFAMPLKNKRPLEKFVITFTIPARNRQSFVRSTTAVAESPTCKESVKCGRDFDRSKIGNVITVIIKARIPTIEAMTPNLFQRVNRLYLWSSVIFTPENSQTARPPETPSPARRQ